MSYEKHLRRIVISDVIALRATLSGLSLVKHVTAYQKENNTNADTDSNDDWKGRQRIRLN